MTEPGKQIIKYVDESMFTAEKTEGREPKVTLLAAPSDPLGELAQLAMMYQGRSPRSLAEITDEDRRYYFEDMRKNILGMPSEAITFHFLIENVSRSYTHQLVRTRQASYAQESLRFAVKEDFPTRMWPMLRNTKSVEERAEDFCRQMGWDIPPANGFRHRGEFINSNWMRAVKTVESQCSELELIRDRFDRLDEHLHREYLWFLDHGVPAEDARGKLPHDILTKVNMVINLRSLMNMAGQRLCTQAQFEHRQVWNQLLGSIRDYGYYGRTYSATLTEGEASRLTVNSGLKGGDRLDGICSGWQFEMIADKFLPVCYQTGKCQFESDFDRYCNIRDRVQAFSKAGIPSSEWHEDHLVSDIGAAVGPGPNGIHLGIPAIHPSEWLDPNAAISPTGDWRSQEAQENIKDRRL